ncbi:MAG: fibro-slime domain-containing protein [Phycisphaerales bacterium]
MTSFAPSILKLTAVLAVAGTLSPVSAAADQYASMPTEVTLSGTVRDFRARNQTGGHNDFERQPSAGFAHYVGQVGDTLGQDGLPVFGSTGYKVTSQWKNSAGKNIISSKPYIAAKPGDVAGSRSSSTGGSLSTAANFNKWFRDDPAVNASTSLPIKLIRQPNTNRYVFDDTLDPAYANKGGFFPINGQLYGNYSSTGKNFHFTYVIETEFTYMADQGHSFTFTGDDDVWVYVDGKLVIDLGGVHSKVSQTIEMDRLTWLQSGQTYSLKFFFAERHTTQSNFRIETTLNLRQVSPPPVTALAD